MSVSTLTLYKTPISTLGLFLEAVSSHQSKDIEDLAVFAGFSTSTAKRVLPSLQTLKLIERDETGYVCIVEGVKRGMSEQMLEHVVKKALLNFRPFESIVEGIALGETVNEAKRKALLMNNLPISDDTKLQILIDWAVELEIIETENDIVKLSKAFEVEAVDRLEPIATQDLESQARSRLFVAGRLGREVNNYLDQVDRDLLSSAVLSYQNNPRGSVDDAGQALEDFLRHTASDLGLQNEARKASGAGQLANLLYTRGHIHSNHQKLIEASSTIRNSTAHRKDKKTLIPWEITSFGAWSATSMSLTSIKSVYYHINKGRQII